MPRLPLLLFVFLVLGASNARADAATEAKLRDALRATTTQLRALEDEKARWQRSEAELKAELQALRAQPPPSKGNDRATATLSRRVNELGEANAKLRTSLSRCEAGTTQRAGGTAAATSDEERKRLTDQVDGLQQKLAASEEKNLEMYQVSKELLGWLEKVGVGGEPFFGWKRVQLENVAQEYADRLQDKKVGRQ